MEVVKSSRLKISKYREVAIEILTRLNKNITPQAADLILTLSEIEGLDIRDLITELEPAFNSILKNKVIIEGRDVSRAYKLTFSQLNGKVVSNNRTKIPKVNTSSINIEKTRKKKRNLTDFLFENKLHTNIREESKKDSSKEIEQKEYKKEDGTKLSIRQNRLQSEDSGSLNSVQIRGFGEPEKVEEVSEEPPKEGVLVSERDSGVHSVSRSVKVELLKSPERISFNESYETFQRIFLDRYRKIKEILLSKNLTNVVNSNDRVNGGDKEHHVIVLVYDKRVVKNGRGGIVVGEDDFGFLNIYVPLQGELKDKFNRLLIDSVVAIKFRKKSGDFLIAEDIIFPDPVRPIVRRRTEEPFKVVFVSDIHIGSKQFLKRYFENFIRFINGEIDRPDMRKLSKDIGALILVGDLVDGIGVYPNQQEELEIIDIYDQFDVLRGFLDRVKDDIEIIAIPGNHDPAGKFIPQPPIPNEFLGDLVDKPNFHVFGNPALVSLNGVKILLYHGQGLEDIASSLNISIKKPTIMMVEEIRHRHILPMWGEEPIIPLEYDPLVIDDVPDIYVTGHLHMVDARITKISGTLLINSSTFQGLTSWQKKLGISPTPGIIPIVDLHTYDIDFLRCDEFGCTLIGGRG